MGNVVSINRSSQKGVVKIPIANGVFIDDFGLKEDAHGGVPIRQVSLLGLESIHKMEDQLNKSLPYGSFAENLTTEGIELFTLPIGTILKIGETIQEVSKIGKECHKGCAIFKEVGKCIMPVEGIFTKVIQGGMVKAGDTIIIERQ
nr:MOSC domain-containing protein [Natranaerovirga hydrolytica]